MSTESPTLGRIVRAFAIAQAIAILAPIVISLFGVDLGSGTSFTLSFVAALYAANIFVQSYGRAPTAEERSRLAWLSLATSLAISLAMLAIFVAIFGQAASDLLANALRALPFGVLAIIVVVACGLCLGSYHVAYGPMARSFEKKLLTKRR